MPIQFTLEEIAKAVGIKPVGVCGVSYGATELLIPLNREFGLLLREGDDTDDHSVDLIKLATANKEHSNNFIAYPQPPPWAPDTESAGYKSGYESGLNWKSDYVPGGPWHYGARQYDKEETRKRALETQLNYQNYMAGFHAGYANNPNKTIKNYKQ